MSVYVLFLDAHLLWRVLPYHFPVPPSPDAIKANPEAYRALQASGSVVKPPRLAVKDLPEKLVVFTQTRKNDAGEDIVVGTAGLFGEDEDLSDL